MIDIHKQNKLLSSEGPECFDDGTGIEPEITESDDQIKEPFDPTLNEVTKVTKVVDFLP
ncbi:MAG: hypothetical protein ISS67_07360 [Desulfobacterales bacterium]|nr:hypothetical protein [Desulfobacterales bacterium]MBL7224951.1 hypothetical protein [Desulfobacteraceae bacterium]